MSPDTSAPPADSKQTGDSPDARAHVKNGDLVQYAKPRCKTCFGKGEFVQVLPSGTRKEKLCGCALQRFLRANGHRVYVDTDQALLWRPGVR